jgi:hypothetical protein
MIVKGNPLLVGASGKLGSMVVKQYKDRIVVTALPDMLHRRLSEKQKAANLKMKGAIETARIFTKNPRLKQKSCELLQVAPNKVFRALVKQYLLNGISAEVFQESGGETEDKKTLTDITTAITKQLPDARIMLFGNRATGVAAVQHDWDLLILTSEDHPSTEKWKLQQMLFELTVQQGACVNIVLAQKDKWERGEEYQNLRKRIEGELVPVG